MLKKESHEGGKRNQASLLRKRGNITYVCDAIKDDHASGVADGASGPRMLALGNADY